MKLRGIKLGRPTTISPHTVKTIQMLRAAGLPFAGIANSLNARTIPTAQGGRRWYASTVKAILDRNSDPPAESGNVPLPADDVAGVDAVSGEIGRR